MLLFFKESSPVVYEIEQGWSHGEKHHWVLYPKYFPLCPSKANWGRSTSVWDHQTPTDFNSLYQKLRKKNHILGFGLGKFLGHFLTASHSVSISPKQKTYPGNQPGKENSHQSEDKRDVPATGCVGVDSCVHNSQTFSLLGNIISKQTEY